MFPTTELREHLRFCILNIMKSSQIFGSSEDSKRVTLFYGRVLTKALFPDGPISNFQPSFPVHHTSYGPWKAETFRCLSLFLSQVYIEAVILKRFLLEYLTIVPLVDMGKCKINFQWFLIIVV